jgi:hypothetical protein
MIFKFPLFLPWLLSQYAEGLQYIYLVITDVKVATVYSSLVLTDELCEVDDWTVMDCKFSLDGAYALYISNIQLPHKGHIHTIAHNLKQVAHSHSESHNIYRYCLQIEG